ncbi:MAG: site-specific integrase [Firmicutes bacterium]|nr:site-specific integrase [Bacillota bacterium]
MLTNFVPGDRVACYHACPHKNRIDLIGRRLVEQRYLPVVIAQHVREWLRFATYLEKRGLTMPLHSRDADAQAYVTERVRTLRSASRVRFVRASIRIFLEADEEGRFRRRVGRAPRPVPSWLASALEQYVTFVQSHRGLAHRTVVGRRWRLVRFAECLGRAGVTSLEAIVPLHVQQFLVDLRAYALGYRLTYTSTLRSFFGWAYAAGLVPLDLSPAVTTPRRFKQSGVRDVLSETEVARILSAVDRSTVIGRRDYAVLILAARYGLRPCDIRQLQLEAINWRDGIVSLKQAKTGRLLTLPLLPDVAAALIAYLRDGRPATTSRHVFVRHRAPFEPFVAANNLSSIMRLALRRVGLGLRSGRRGLYLFRHTLASRMLAAKCQIKVIADVLGHKSTETTMEYASIDLATLRCVPISEEEVRA